MPRRVPPLADAVRCDPRWEAVCARDAGADGRFVYAVRSTGVYCRPGCAARRPRPDNVCFFDDGAAARAAGFRPCQRCRPDLPPLAQRQAERVAAMCRAIEAAASTPTLDALAAGAGLSRFHAFRLFKQHTGLTPRAYGSAVRAERLREHLAAGVRVTEAIYAAGYGGGGDVHAAAPRLLGMQPRRYRTGAAGERIRVAITACALGRLLVAATERGVCAIMLGDDDDALRADLDARFVHAERIDGDAEFERWVAQVVAGVAHPRHGLDLPLDIRGTAFQQRVWRALRDIPPGQTATYTDIAARIGTPRAVRAVAGACAANPLALAIPCHRVLRQDGHLAGYRWGVARKRALLDAETDPTEPADGTE